MWNINGIKWAFYYWSSDKTWWLLASLRAKICRPQDTHLQVTLDWGAAYPVGFALGWVKVSHTVTQYSPRLQARKEDNFLHSHSDLQAGQAPQLSSFRACTTGRFTSCWGRGVDKKGSAKLGHQWPLSGINYLKYQTARKWAVCMFVWLWVQCAFGVSPPEKGRNCVRTHESIPGPSIWKKLKYIR